MKAIILVGGEGTRLRPLTCNTPKGMVPVLNRPFLEYMFLQLKQAGVNEIILAESRHNQRINDYFGDGSHFGIKLFYQVEPEPRGTAGGIKNAEEFIDETFLVLNGDIYNDLDIRAMIASHRSNKAKITIALTPVEDPTAYGLVETTKSGQVTRFLEKPDKSQVTTNMINAGTYILEPEVLDCIPAEENCSIEKQVFPVLVKKGDPVFGFASSGYWIDIGTPQKYMKLNFDLLEKQADQARASVIAGKGSVVSSGAKVRGSIMLGENCKVEAGATLTGPLVLGDNCRLEAGSTVSHSVIWDNALVGEGTAVADSVIANGCTLNSSCEVRDAVLGDNVTLSGTFKLPSSEKVWPDTVLKK